MRTALTLIFAIIILSLIGCGQEAGSADPENGVVAVNTIPPEPTNTPAPPTEPPPAGDPCSVAGQQQQIDAAFASYQAVRTADSDALLSLTDWLNDTTATIATQCHTTAFELSTPDELADLYAKLQEGGYVVYVRHTHTDRSRGDTDTSLGRCETQRILSDRGRDEAFLIRNAYQQLGLPVSQIISTQYCRTLETAVLAFGVPQVILRSDLHAILPQLLATQPANGTNVLIVAHIGTIRDRVGLDDTFEEGDSLVYRPTGDGNFEFVGRIGLYDWPVLATLSE